MTNEARPPEVRIFGDPRRYAARMAAAQLRQEHTMPIAHNLDRQPVGDDPEPGSLAEEILGYRDRFRGDPDHGLELVRNARSRRYAEIESLERRAAAGPLTASDDRKLKAHRREFNELDALLGEFEREAPAERAIRAQWSGLAHVRHEPGTYRPDGDASYFRDLVTRQLFGDSAATERLARHAAEVQTRDISRTDGAGGEFVPPLWLMDQYAEFARAGRVTADRFTKLPLPPGTDSVNIPRITTGPQVAIQTADNAAVQETDAVTNSVSAPVRTLAGQQDVAIQLLEQSPAAMDRVIFSELTADFHRALNAQVINGSGSSGQLQGILGLSGINSVTYTDASPTVPELYPKVAAAAQAVIDNRLLPPDAIVMSPRRWMWMIAALDSSSRPLVVPTASGPNNAAAISSGFDANGGPVGTMLGLPVYIDPTIPTNLGGGTNEDRIVVARFSDAILMESNIRTRVLPDVLSGNLTVRLQVYGYVAVAPGRFPASFSVVSGTGLVTPVL